MGKDDNSSFMNNRIPRKKTASSLTNSGSKSTTGINSATTVSTAKQCAAATCDTLSFRIPRKSKDDKQPNNKKRTHDMSISIATTTTKVKKVKTTVTSPRHNNDSIPPQFRNY